MTTQISTKIAALALALLMNGAMIGGVAYLFNSQRANAAVITLAAA